MSIQNLQKVCDRQNRRHPDLVSPKAGALIQLRAIERDIQSELPAWQRQYTEPLAEEPPRRTTWRPRGGYTRELLKCIGASKGHDHWPVRPAAELAPKLRREWGVEWLPSLVLDGVLFPMRWRP